MSIERDETVDLELFEAMAHAGLIGVGAKHWRDFEDANGAPTTDDAIAVRDGLARMLGRLPARDIERPCLATITQRPTVKRRAQEQNLLFGSDSADSAAHAPGGGPRVKQLYEVVADAYAAVSAGFSTDRLLADPMRNYEFIQHCWKAGARASAFELNWALMNVRKAGKLSGLPNAERYSMARAHLDEFTFASEFALRGLQERYYYRRQFDVSLDRVLCDPSLAAEFEELARRIRPGFSSFEYRWAVILLRKARRAAHEVADLTSSFTVLGRNDAVRLSDVPRTAGVYWFQAEKCPLFVGVAEDIRAQVERHFETSGVAIVPDWMRDREYGPAQLAILEAPRVSASNRERMKVGMLSDLRPRLNYISDHVGSLLGAA